MIESLFAVLIRQWWLTFGVIVTTISGIIYVYNQTIKKKRCVSLFWPRIEAEFMPIVRVLDEDDGRVVDDITISQNSIYLKGKYNRKGEHNELYLRFKKNEAITIARIGFRNTRNRYGKRILDWLKKYANKNGYKRIIVEATQSTEINGFCDKYGFVKVPGEGKFDEETGVYYGNYVLELNDDVFYISGPQKDSA